MKLLIKCALVFAICILFARFCHEKTDGFRMSKVENNTIEGSCPQQEVVMDIFNQPFTYLARGKESFVFLSEDGKTVLKLLNNRYQKEMSLYAYLPDFSWKKERLAYLRKKLLMARDSYLLSYEELREETGLLFLHLQKTTHLNQRVKIRDKLGIAHEIDLDKSAFILQKRAESAYVQFEKWIHAGDISSAKKGLTSLMSLLHTRLGKGISDKDPLIRTNIGFIDGRATFLDLGPFSKKAQLNKREEIEKIAHSLKNWLQEKNPSLAAFLDEEVKK